MAPPLKISLATLASNKALFAAMEEFAKTKKKQNLIAFLADDTTDTEKATRKYLVPGAPKELKLSKAIFAAATKAVTPRWSEMGPAIDAAKAQIQKLIESDSLGRFSTTKEYGAYRSKNPKAPVQVNLAALVKDKKILALAIAHAKSEFNDENLEFLFFKGKPADLYNRFIVEGAPRQINLPSPVFDMFGKVVAPEKSALAAVVRDARAAVADYVEKTMIPEFVYSEPFAEAVAQSGKGGDLKKVAKTLGIKEVGLLKQAFAVRFAGDTQGAEKLFKKLAKIERMPSEAQILEALENIGF